MTETQRLVWLMAHPVCAEVNNAMQQLTSVQYNILTSMAQQNVLQYSFKKKYQAVTLSTSAVKVNNETIQIDPHLLLQRRIAAGTRN